MNKTKIDWPGLTHTWNPITGCLNGCDYCYARKIAHRFDGHFDPTMHYDRLKQPIRHKKPAVIFVGSMADMWGDWVQDAWIGSVLKVVRQTPQHTYMFLTKNPKRYDDFDFTGLKNVWIGMTLTGAESGGRFSYMCTVKPPVKRFLSIEPLMGKMKEDIPWYVDLVIVGAMTGAGAVPPKKEWINSIKHDNIYFKQNIKKYLEAGK